MIDFKQTTKYQSDQKSDFYLRFMEGRELTKPDYSDSLITIPAPPSEVTRLNCHSEQGSNSFGYTDTGWELEAKMPDITSILAPT